MKTLNKLLLGIGLLYSASAFAQDFTYPAIPVRGNVTGAEISATIEAKVSSETVGSATVRQDLTYRMDIAQDNPGTEEDEGASINDTVEFYSSGKKADETITFDGDAKTQNLTFPEDTPTPENTPTDTPKPPTNTPTDTPSPTDTPLPTNTYTETPTDTPKPPTNTPTYTPEPIETDTPLPTNTYTETPKPPTNTPTNTEYPTTPPTDTPTDTPSPSYTPTYTPKPIETYTPTPEFNTDLNQDGITNDKDLLLFIGQWKTEKDRLNHLHRFLDDWYQ